MKIIEIKEDQKEEWNKFITDNNSESFLQSFEWGKFQEAIGKKIFRIGVEYEGEILAVALLVKYDLPFGKRYLYCPRGPVFKNIEAFKILFDEIKKIAKKEKSLFLRFDPPLVQYNEQRILNQKYILSFKKTPFEIQPKDTLILDLNKSKDELLKEMKPKTRYNIRLASKKGVKIISTSNYEKYFQNFWDLTEETSKRDKFVSHGKDYYWKMLENLSKEICYSEFIPESIKNKDLDSSKFTRQGSEKIEKIGGFKKKILNQVQDDSMYFDNDFGNNENKQNLHAKLYLAKFEEKIIASNIVLYFGDLAIYLHGASSNEQRNLMAPYLLQWQQIQDAKVAGYKKYDFWGITIAGEKESWQGITKFKKGFSGVEKRYIGAYDLAIDKLVYNLYQTVKKVKRSCHAKS
ncbi:MAG: peptidoglycan bridge formation glycyltransferase FemA/FemB family protein [Patescibacteria group bacterium]|nr:peptidoglycan bridge formation glycyltransferase FemA/FemB family protein [Patescibacteria group bacterium]